MRLWIKWGIAALVLAALAVGGVRFMAQRKAQQATDAARLTQRAEAGVELAPTDLVQVQMRDLDQALPISGTLKASNAVIIKARVAGELQGFTLREGDVVRAGQIVARVEPTDSQARLRQSQQQAESAKAQVEIAQRTFDNNRSLVEQGFISRWALDSSSATLASAEGNYRAAVAGADVARKALDDTVLRSPITGQVAQRLAQNGERMALDGRVVEIVDLNRLELEASLSPADAMQVQPGQTALLQIEGAAAPVLARVVRVNPTVVTGSRAVLAYLVLDPLPGLRQGLFAQGKLSIGSMQAAAVPLSAVRTDKPAPYVQLISNTNKVLHQPVELGARGEVGGQTMVVIKGVPVNTSLLVGTVGTLREGTPITVTAGVK